MKISKTELKLSNELEQSADNEKNLDFDTLMNIDGECYRQVKSRATLRVHIYNKIYYIKKYFPVKFKEIIKNIIIFKLPSNSASNEIAAIKAVALQNIKTLEITGYGFRKNLWRETSFLLTRAIEPSISLDKLLEQYLNHNKYFKLKRSLISYLAIISKKLHTNGLNHRDYYICHFLLNIDHKLSSKLKLNSINDELLSGILQNIYLIDLHRMQIRDKVPARYIIKDLSALMFSVRNYKITRADYLRFLKIYNYDFIYNKKILKKIVSKASSMREKG